MEADAEAQNEAFGWWRRKDIPTYYENGSEDPTEIVYTGLQEGLSTIAAAITTEGPFDGVIGFSQGACAAAIVASLLDSHAPARFHAFSLQSDNPVTPFSILPSQQPLKFAVIYSGFLAPGKRYAAFYDPPIRVPTLHFLGQLDGVVEEGRSRALVERCEGARVVVHPGGHFLPSQRPWLDAVCGFVRECVVERNGDGKGNGEMEERVEDMDVPF